MIIVLRLLKKLTTSGPTVGAHGTPHGHASIQQMHDPPRTASRTKQVLATRSCRHPGKKEEVRLCPTVMAQYRYVKEGQLRDKGISRAKSHKSLKRGLMPFRRKPFQQ